MEDIADASFPVDSDFFSDSILEGGTLAFLRAAVAGQIALPQNPTCSATPVRRPVKNDRCS
jgi:hypothetical protein